LFQYQINNFVFSSNQKVIINQELVLDTKFYTLKKDVEPNFSIVLGFQSVQPKGLFTGVQDVTEKVCNIKIENNYKCYNILISESLSSGWVISFHELDTIKDPDMDIKNNLDPNAPYFSYPADKYLRDYQLGDWFTKYFKLLDYNYTSILIYIDRKYEKDSAEFKQAFDEAISLINDISKAQKLTNE
jgi:hypothetical protein